MDSGLSILYIAPTFLADRRSKAVRGVQVFDFFFIRDLVGLGHRVTIPAERTWKPRLIEHLGDLIDAGTVHLHLTPRLVKPLWNGMHAALTLAKPGGKPFDAAFLGNATRGISLPVSMMLKRGLFSHIAVQANRAPRDGFSRAVRRWPASLTAVSELVRTHFPADLQHRVTTYYGIVNWQDFAPGPRQLASPARGSGEGDDLIHCCVIGALDNEWKGAHLAIEAMGKLPADVAPRCRLHLSSYATPPVISDPRIILHPWRPAGEVPDHLRAMDIMLVPSTGNETFSQAMVQGMLTGLPQIVYNFGVLTEKLDTGGGLVFTTTDELAAHIALLARDSVARRAMGARARQVALERYRWSSAEFVERFMLGRTPAAAASTALSSAAVAASRSDR